MTPPLPAVYLCSEERGDVVEAVAVVVGGDELQDGELSSLRHGQVNTQAEAGGGGEGQPQTVTLTGQTLHSFTGWHVLQHVCLQQTRLLLQGDITSIILMMQFLLTYLHCIKQTSIAAL